MASIQLPSNAGGSDADAGDTQSNVITLDDSADDDNGGATTSKVSNNEIVSFYLLLYSCIYMDV